MNHKLKVGDRVLVLPLEITWAIDIAPEDEIQMTGSISEVNGDNITVAYDKPLFIGGWDTISNAISGIYSYQDLVPIFIASSVIDFTDNKF
jgi:hypothetical protein